MMTENEDTKTSFDVNDLIIRKRIDAYNAALQSNAAARIEVKDDLLAQFSREVENLQSQLGQVEQSFGKNDPMARVLREAVESAKSRLETRRIELALDKEEDEAKQKAAKKVAFTPVFERKAEPEKQGIGGLGWAAAYILLTQNQNRFQPSLGRSF